MKALAGGLAIVALAATASTAVGRESDRRGTSCAGARWAVRNLLDADAARVDYMARSTTIPALRRLSRPSVGRGTARRRPAEFRTYHVRAALVRTRRSTAADVELVIRDVRTGQLMAVVFPDTHLCVEIAAGLHGDDIHAASDEFLGDCGPLVPSRRPMRLSGKAMLAGVGFFEVGSQKRFSGAAINGFQLHPVLEFASANCRRP